MAASRLVATSRLAQNSLVKVALTFIIHDMGVRKGIAIVYGD